MKEGREGEGGGDDEEEKKMYKIKLVKKVLYWLLFDFGWRMCERAFECIRASNKYVCVYRWAKNWWKIIYAVVENSSVPPLPIQAQFHRTSILSAYGTCAVNASLKQQAAECKGK